MAYAPIRRNCHRDGRPPYLDVYNSGWELSLLNTEIKNYASSLYEKSSMEIPHPIVCTSTLSSAGRSRTIRVPAIARIGGRATATKVSGFSGIAPLRRQI